MHFIRGIEDNAELYTQEELEYERLKAKFLLEEEGYIL